VRPTQHVVITGRGGHGLMAEDADLVTEMTQATLPYLKGVKAQPGVEC